MAAIDDLTTAKDNVAAILADLTANPKPDYSVDGQSVSWSSYFMMLTNQYLQLAKLIAFEGGPYELRTTIVT